MFTIFKYCSILSLKLFEIFPIKDNVLGLRKKKEVICEFVNKTLTPIRDTSQGSFVKRNLDSISE